MMVRVNSTMLNINVENPLMYGIALMPLRNDSTYNARK